MSRVLIGAVVQLVRLWTVMYTCGLRADVRDQRRADVACDVWHSVHDPDGGGGWRLSLQIVLRLIPGIPDDLAWRLEQANRGAFAVAAGAATLCILALVAARSFHATEAPLLPEAPRTRSPEYVRPPPPAPGVPAQPRSPMSEWVYGRTSYSVTTDSAAPVRIAEVRPVYPPVAIAAALQGVVVVQGRITEAGRVTDVRVVGSAGILSQSVVDAVHQWRFAPLQTHREAVLTVTASFVPPH